MRRPKLSHLLVATTFLFVGIALSGPLDLTQTAKAERLWVEKQNDKGGLDPNGPVKMNSFVKLAKMLSPAVVNISVVKSGNRAGRFNFMGRHRHHRGDGMPSGMGSGFIIHPEGWILTNQHVVADAKRVKIKLQTGEVYDARIAGTDKATDTALLKIDVRKRLVAAPLGDSDILQTGAWVVAIGNPFGLNHTVTAGIVSAKGRRNVHPGNSRLTGVQMYENFIQTDASINPGNSGGPLINIRGEVIGINTAINAAGQGIGFAIPINMVKALVPQLQTGKVSRSWLGVSIQQVSREMSESVGLSPARGALVAEVIQRGPADNAGIQPGDVILEFAGEHVKTSRDLPWLASTAGVGHQVDVVVWRDRRRRLFKVTLGQLPSDPRQAKSQPRSQPKSKLSSKIGMSVGKSPGTQGLVVQDVSSGSSAEWAGVKSGDTILKVNYKSVNTMKAFRRHVASVHSGEIISLVVKRGSRTLFIAFTKK